MPDVDKNKRPISDLLNVIFKWKKLLFINLIIITAITVVISFIIDEKFKSSGTVIISSGADNDLQLGGMLSDVGSLLGVGNLTSGSTENLLGILGSRTLKMEIINRYDLIDYYEITKFPRDKALKYIEDDYFYELNENGMIDIAFIHKNPQTAVDIVNFIIDFADSLNIDINLEKAKNYRVFVEERYNKSIQDLYSAEDELQAFQEETGLFVLPEQLMINFEALVNLEAELFSREVELEILESADVPNTPSVNELTREIKILSKRIEDIKSGKGSKSKSISFYPIEDLPPTYAKYIRIFRNYEIQNRILETLTPMYEQALMEEQKKMPSVIALDKPIPAEIKESPKRSIILAVVFILAFFIHVFFVTAGESYLIADVKNPFEEKMVKFFTGIKKFYAIKN